MRKRRYQPGLITPPDLMEWIERTGYQPSHEQTYTASVRVPKGDDEQTLYQKIAHAEMDVQSWENEVWALESELEKAQDELQSAEYKLHRLTKKYEAMQRERLGDQAEPINFQGTLRIKGNRLKIINIRLLER